MKNTRKYSAGKAPLLACVSLTLGLAAACSDTVSLGPGANGDAVVPPVADAGTALAMDARVEIVDAASPAICGNAQREGAETCDDGNAVSGDGCSAACQAEAGYTCVGAGASSCAHPTCVSPAFWVRSACVTWRAEASGTTENIRALWASSPTDIWAVANRGDILHKVGNAAWAAVASPATDDVSRLAGFSASDIFALERGNRVLHWNGTSWSLLASQPVAAGVAYDNLWGLSASDLWVSGSSFDANTSSYAHWDGSAWTYHTSAGALSQRMWGSSSADIWSTGGTVGSFVHWTGAAWASVPSGSQAIMRDVHGTSPSDIWAVGRGGIVTRWNGSVWQPMGTGLTTDLLRVKSLSSVDVWALEGNGAQYWNGASWSRQSFDIDTTDLWATSPTDVWVAGWSGALLHLSP